MCSAKKYITRIRNHLITYLNREEGIACIKQRVGAIIQLNDGKFIYGSNNIYANITICPREEQGFPTGEGYHLCKDICKHNHAEIDAIINAQKESVDISDCILFLYGHTYCCDQCILKMKEAGLKECCIIDDSNTIIKYYNLKD